MMSGLMDLWHYYNYLMMVMKPRHVCLHYKMKENDSQPVIDLYAYEKLPRTDNFSYICLLDGV
jgi:hypothetical protein